MRGLREGIIGRKRKMDKKIHTLVDALFNEKNDDKHITFVESTKEEHTETYEEFRQEVVKYAAFLRENGVHKGDYLVVSVEEIRKFVTALWAGISTGAVVVPIVPPEQGEYMEGKSETKRVKSILEELSGCWYLLDERNKEKTRDWETGERKIWLPETIRVNDTGAAVEENLTEQDPAILLFTSGSTGKPKGVEISHRKAIEGCCQNIRFFGDDENTRYLNWLPLEHIASLMLNHVLPVLLKAEQVQMHTRIVLEDVTQWLHYMSMYATNVSFGPDFIYSMILDRKDEIQKMDISLASVKRIVNGGEAINVKVTDKSVEFLESKGFKRGAMVPGWGMTEIGNGAIYSFRFGEVMSNHCPAIGTPVPDLKVRIHNADGVVEEEEVEGSLQIQGDFILDRYFGDSEEEKNRYFTEDGWFITGDLACIKDGEFVLTGRTANTFILNGNNYSVGEIENSLTDFFEKQQKRVEFKLVNGKNSDTNRDELYLFLDTSGEDAWDELSNQIRNFLSSSYGFSVSKILYVEDGLPRKGIGKVDTKALVERMRAGIYKEFLAVAEENARLYSDEENLMCFIFADALKLDKKTIGIDDDFFLLGGNSALVPTVLNRINDLFKKKINAAQFVEMPTIKKLLAFIHEGAKTDEMDLEDEEIIVL